MLPLQPGVTQTYVTATSANYNGTSKPGDASTSSSSGQTGEINSPAANAKSLLTSENLSRINAHHNNNNNNGASKSYNTSQLVQMKSLLIDVDDDDDEEHDEDGEQIGEFSDATDSGISQGGDDVAQKLSDDPGIQSLMEISLPSPFPANMTSDECTFHELQRLS